MAAVFLPETLEHDFLVAHVLPGGPAARAGVRDGDVLRAVDGEDFTDWRKRIRGGGTAGRFEGKAGTKLRITVRRGEKEMTLVVTLEDILTPPAPAAGDAGENE